MPDFTVDVNGSDGLSKNLNRTSENIDNATKKPAHLGPDSIGSDELDEVCADFRDDWKEGLGEIREAVGAIKKGLDKGWFPVVVATPVVSWEVVMAGGRLPLCRVVRVRFGRWCRRGIGLSLLRGWWVCRPRPGGGGSPRLVG